MLGIFPALHRKPGALRKANVHRHNRNKAAFPCAVMGNEFSAYSISAGYCLERSWIFLFLHRVNNFFLNSGTSHFTDVDLLRERDGLGTSAPSSSTAVLASLHFPAQCCSVPLISRQRYQVCSRWSVPALALPFLGLTLAYNMGLGDPFPSLLHLSLIWCPSLGWLVLPRVLKNISENRIQFSNIRVYLMASSASNKKHPEVLGTVIYLLF